MRFHYLSSLLGQPVSSFVNYSVAPGLLQDSQVPKNNEGMQYWTPEQREFLWPTGDANMPGMEQRPYVSEPPPKFEPAYIPPEPAPAPSFSAGVLYPPTQAPGEANLRPAVTPTSPVMAEGGGGGTGLTPPENALTDAAAVAGKKPMGVNPLMMGLSLLSQEPQRMPMPNLPTHRPDATSVANLIKMYRGGLLR